MRPSHRLGSERGNEMGLPEASPRPIEGNEIQRRPSPKIRVPPEAQHHTLLVLQSVLLRLTILLLSERLRPRYGVDASAVESLCRWTRAFGPSSRRCRSPASCSSCNMGRPFVVEVPPAAGVLGWSIDWHLNLRIATAMVRNMCS